MAQRSILGPVQQVDGSLRVMKNRKIAEPNIIGALKYHRLCWLGHVERMGDDRAAKREYLGLQVNRPRYRWNEEAEKHFFLVPVPD